MYSRHDGSTASNLAIAIAKPYHVISNFHAEGSHLGYSKPLGEARHKMGNEGNKIHMRGIKGINVLRVEKDDTANMASQCSASTFAVMTGG